MALTPEQMALRFQALADQALAVAAQHDREAHGGKACLAVRCQIIGYLAHRLAVRNGLWDQASACLAQMDAECEAEDCDHGLGPFLPSEDEDR
jgi:hypothetical protein